MSKILIEVTGAKGVLEQQAALEDELRDLSQSIDSIRSGLRIKIAGQKNIGDRLSEAAARVSKEAEKTSGLRDGLKSIIEHYENAEDQCISAFGGVETTDELNKSLKMAGGELESEVVIVRQLVPPDKKTKTFDDDASNGTYGADQGNMLQNKAGKDRWFSSDRKGNDKEFFDYIRNTYKDKYGDYTDDEIAALLERINVEGCGYVALVNTLFTYYELHKDEFEETFGFPMYNEAGEANYDYLLLDIYAETDNMYYLNSPIGSTSLVNDVIRDYQNKDGTYRKEEFHEKYDCDPVIYDPETNGYVMTPDAITAILDEYKNQTYVTKESEGTTIYSIEDRFWHYMDKKGVDMSYSTISVSQEDMPSAGEINQYLCEGNSVSVGTSGFQLYDENGKAVHENVGPHWMTITGITKDGDYIVSSWGERYYLKPSELHSADFFIAMVNP